jgi:hypothetical protein
MLQFFKFLLAVTVQKEIDNTSVHLKRYVTLRYGYTKVVPKVMSTFIPQ